MGTFIVPWLLVVQAHNHGVLGAGRSLLFEKSEQNKGVVQLGSVFCIRSIFGDQLCQNSFLWFLWCQDEWAIESSNERNERTLFSKKQLQNTDEMCAWWSNLTLLGWWKRDPFQWLSDLQLGDEKVTAWITWWWSLHIFSWEWWWWNGKTGQPWRDPLATLELRSCWLLRNPVVLTVAPPQGGNISCSKNYVSGLIDRKFKILYTVFCSAVPFSTTTLSVGKMGLMYLPARRWKGKEIAENTNRPVIDRWS